MQEASPESFSLFRPCTSLLRWSEPPLKKLFELKVVSKLKEHGYSFWSNRESEVTALPGEAWNSPYRRSLLLTRHEYADLMQESWLRSPREIITPSSRPTTSSWHGWVALAQGEIPVQDCNSELSGLRNTGVTGGGRELPLGKSTSASTQ